MTQSETDSNTQAVVYDKDDISYQWEKDGLINEWYLEPQGH